MQIFFYQNKKYSVTIEVNEDDTVANVKEKVSKKSRQEFKMMLFSKKSIATLDPRIFIGSLSEKYFLICDDSFDKENFINLIGDKFDASINECSGFSFNHIAYMNTIKYHGGFKKLTPIFDDEAVVENNCAKTLVSCDFAGCSPFLILNYATQERLFFHHPNGPSSNMLSNIKLIEKFMKNRGEKELVIIHQLKKLHKYHDALLKILLEKFDFKEANVYKIPKIDLFNVYWGPTTDNNVTIEKTLDPRNRYVLKLFNANQTKKSFLLFNEKKGKIKSAALKDTSRVAQILGRV